MDPGDFNLQHPALMLKTAAMGALLAGIISMAKFLSTQPLPAVKEVTDTTKTISSGSGPSMVIESHQEKRLEPMPPKDPA